jgi:hypothetical protein
MVFPFILLLGIGLASYLVSTPKKTSTVSQGVRMLEDPRTYHLRLLRRALKHGKAPTPTLVDRAIAEAYEMGHWETVERLTNAFQTQDPQDVIVSESESPKIESEPGEKVAIIIGKNSPLQGVSNEDWEEFVSKLRTQDPSFATDKHIGAYHHNRERLSQLGYEDLTKLESDEQAQYQAIEKDMSDCYQRQAKLIRDYCGDVVSIDGNDHPVTASGLLGLMKSAGVKNAESWLANPDERKTFPHTTKMFLQTNGVF